jgi:DMSO/TMAO reductase YedYZ molybdopterin-dependent catalytic subunit
MAPMAKMAEGQEFSREEVGLALRNPGMPLEGLRYPITPIGMHYLLIHFDIPLIDAATYELSITGRVRNLLKLTLDDLMACPAVTMPVTMECAGNGRAHLSPRPVSAPWHNEAVGCAEWTGTPLKPLLEEAGLLDDAVEILFTGHDRGIDQDVEQDYERSLPLDEALRDEVFLAYEMNGRPLPPQHGSPLRLVVPDWYGMTSVKWLREITVLDKPFEGVQQALLYRYKRSENDPGTPVTRKNPHALMVPPGIPEYLSRARHLRAGRTLVEGRAWSGFGPIERVEFSPDGGGTWEDTELGEQIGHHAWRGWSYEWDAREPGEYELCVRATDAAGNRQPASNDEAWNLGGYGVNLAQCVPVSVS